MQKNFLRDIKLVGDGPSKINYLNSFHGGLGDWLQFSTLPEELYRQLGQKTYVINGASFRNNGIRDLVMMNPYIAGISGDVRDWNCGDIPDHQSRLDGQDQNGVKVWERFFDLKPVSTSPKTYYDPTKREDLKNTVLVAMNGVTRYLSGEMVNTLNDVLGRYENKTIIRVTHTKEIHHKEFDNFKHDDTILVENLMEYCDILASCDAFISTHSGQSHLSSAMKQHNDDLESVCIVEESLFSVDRNRGTHLYDNINYITF